MDPQLVDLAAAALGVEDVNATAEGGQKLAATCSGAGSVSVIKVVAISSAGTPDS